ncbi:complex i assembly factor timmdc1, mitochondrial [Plakobranchus ocellatus]|uniref:Complex I assembly factor TIMMDC1, mitochondrial n=1 Tax=Plakobranchus ocellatus TaxID=259542 RepID=A0AAV3Z4U7_9GAST|nr:complex i assembly factor timmdc1, mitochondrial [Plakobranchus ocellatus]
MIFPFAMCSGTNYKKHWPGTSFVGQWLLNSFKVHAAHTDSAEDAVLTTKSENSEEKHHNSESITSMHLNEFYVLANAYIQQETGKERVRMMFQKDHIGRNSPEMEYIQVTLVQTFVISFLMKYIPEFRLARQDFIREHHGTVFRTRLEAVRRMQDHVSLRAAMAGGKFATKITAFGAGFVFLSQIIASYRNKTSVLEYTIAAGLTGGLARIQLGIKGFIAGSFLGCVLGSLVGLLAYTTLTAYDVTQEQRHFNDIMSLLEVQKSVEGETAFKKKLELVRSKQDVTVLPAS